MRKLLLMGCLCMGGLMLAGADGSCTITDNRDLKKENNDPQNNDPAENGNTHDKAALIRYCKAFEESWVLEMVCWDNPNNEWAGSFKTEKETNLVGEHQDRCDGTEPEYANYLEEDYQFSRCKTLNLNEATPALEAYAKALREAESCDERDRLEEEYENPDYCLEWKD